MGGKRHRFITSDFSNHPSEDMSAFFGDVMRQFHKKGLKDFQKQALQALRRGHDIIVRAGTGMGKSLIFQGMALSSPKAIVLVVSPLIALMEDQVTECGKNDLSAVALTKENTDKDPTIWNKLRDGEYRVVYASPEMLLDPSSKFQNQIIRENNEFMRNIALIAVDECHAIWSWEEFRPLFQHIGKLRLIFSDIPVACLSATLLPNVAAYVHEVCKLKYPTVKFSLSIRRDDINLVVVPINNLNNIQPLLNLVKFENVKKIPKTIIFVDSVDRAAHITLHLKYALASKGDQHVIDGILSDETIGGYWSSIDDKQKKNVLSKFRSGETRIVVATDAFSLGINIDDVALVYQWGVTDKLSLEIFWQRTGRGSRGINQESFGIVFAQSNLLQAAPGSWAEAWAKKPPPVDETSDPDDLDEEVCIIPVNKGRVVAKFSLPVTRETKKLAKRHLSGMYKEAEEIKHARKAAKQELTGTKENRMKSHEKVNGLMFWTLNTDGCRHQVIKIAFCEPGDIFAVTHRGLCCCDICALKKGLDPSTNIAPGITLGDTAAYLWNNSSNGRIKLPKHLAGGSQNNSRGRRRAKVSDTRKEDLKLTLIKWRRSVWKSAKLPRRIRPYIILPDATIGQIVKSAESIVTVDQLQKILYNSGVDLASSWLSPPHLCSLLELINITLENRLQEESIQTAPVLAPPTTPRPTTVSEISPAVPPPKSLPSALPRKSSETEDASDYPSKRRKLDTQCPAITAAPVGPSVETDEVTTSVPSKSKQTTRRQTSRQPLEPLQLISNMQNARRGSNKRVPKPSARLLGNG